MVSWSARHKPGVADKPWGRRTPPKLKKSAEFIFLIYPYYSFSVE
jgi:hypothetical protein